jgi:hypothetical protein
VTVAVRGTDLHVLDMRARMPFRYGTACLTALPHLFVSVALEVGGRAATGVAADGLPPKWFTKEPDASFDEEVRAQLEVIAQACTLARGIPAAPTVFDLWHDLYVRQARWAASGPHPPLLWNFGVSLVERAVLDAFCRLTGTTFADAVRRNTLGIRLGDLYDELADLSPADLLPRAPLRSIRVRHTVGLADPLTEDEIAAEERLDDGLPQALEACIRAYDLTHFKIKVSGDVDASLARLRRVAAVVEATAGRSFAFTLDGNEQYRDLDSFRGFWRALSGDAALAGFMQHLLFVEQPFHRDVALSADVRRGLGDWPSRPPLVIDESGSTLESVVDAVEGGYAGASHKSCKGVLKGLASACLLELRRRRRREPHVLSGEDLAIVGPVALLEDLAVMATLGIEHVERNGHHYFAGLSMFPDRVQAQVLAAHGDLYRRHERGFPTLAIRDGRIAIGSVVDAPFGVGFPFDPAQFTPLEAWKPDWIARSEAFLEQRMRYHAPEPALPAVRRNVR